MKPRWDESGVNTPHEMLVRAAYLAGLAGLTGGILLTLTGAAAHDPRLLAVGVTTLLFALLTRDWLHRQEQLPEAEKALNAMAQSEPPLDAMRVAELVRLLQEWERLEGKRGSSDFDPWAVQALRHDIRVMVEKDPALDRLFRV